MDWTLKLGLSVTVSLTVIAEEMTDGIELSTSETEIIESPAERAGLGD